MNVLYDKTFNNLCEFVSECIDSKSISDEKSIGNFSKFELHCKFGIDVGAFYPDYKYTLTYSVRKPCDYFINKTIYSYPMQHFFDKNTMFFDGFDYKHTESLKDILSKLHKCATGMILYWYNREFNISEYSEIECPNCGAKVKEKDHVCEYCGTEFWEVQ